VNANGDNVSLKDAAGDIELGTVVAGDNLKVIATDATAGSIKQTAAGSVTAGTLATDTAKFEAVGDVALGNAANDFVGEVSATGVGGTGATGGAVTIGDKNDILLDTVTAGGNLAVTAGAGGGDGSIAQTAGGVVTVGTTTAPATTTLAAKGDITLANANDFSGNVSAKATAPSAGTATGTIALNDVNDLALGTVTADKDVTATAANNLAVNGNVDAKGGNATVTATAGSITSAAGATIGAGNTVTATAKNDMDVNVDAKNVNVTAGGNADVDIVKGAHNTTGNLDVNSNMAGTGKTSINAGGNLDLNVAGDIETSGGSINAGGNLTLNAATAMAPLNLNVGGTTIDANLSEQKSIAIVDNGKDYVVNGNDSRTAVLIDGRVAGGDPRFFSGLIAYDAEVGNGVVSGPLPVPNVFSVFTASILTMDMPIGAPANLGQSYPSDDAGTIDAGEDLPAADGKLSIPGLPKNSTIFFGTSNDDGKKDGEKKDGGVAML
jgi:filamentous hemagglutinin